MLLTPRNGGTAAEIQNWHNEFCKEFEEGSNIMEPLTGFQVFTIDKHR